MLVIKLLAIFSDAKAVLDPVDPAVKPVNSIVQSFNLALKTVQPLVEVATTSRVSTSRESATSGNSW